MQQYYNAIACELEREGVWKDPSKFTNTDALKYVQTEESDKSKGVPIRFAPIYHFVNNKYDRMVSSVSLCLCLSLYLSLKLSFSLLHFVVVSYTSQNL
jgi:hypothetical protein